MDFSQSVDWMVIRECLEKEYFRRLELKLQRLLWHRSPRMALLLNSNNSYSMCGASVFSVRRQILCGHLTFCSDYQSPPKSSSLWELLMPYLLTTSQHLNYSEESVVQGEIHKEFQSSKVLLEILFHEKVLKLIKYSVLRRCSSSLAHSYCSHYFECHGLIYTWVLKLCTSLSE